MAKKEKIEVFSNEPQSDNFRETFKEGISNMLEMSEFLKDWEQNSKWYTLSLDQMLTAVESGGPLMLADIKSRYTFMDGTTDEAILSTIENGLQLGTPSGSQMVVVSSEVDPYRSYALCLSDTGIQSLIMRAGVDCSSIWKASIADKKTIVDIGLKVSKDKKALALFSYGKVRTFNGGTTYCVLKQSVMLDAIIKMLNEQYKAFDFTGGTFTHTRTTANFELTGDTDSILETYNDACEAAGCTRNKGFKVQFEFSTSEIGEECATVSVLLARGSMRVLIGSAIKIPHANGMTTDDFVKALPQLLAKTKDLVGGLEKLLTVEIKYPINCAIAIAKQVGLSKAQTLTCVADIQKMLDNAQKLGETPKSTAHDVFYTLQEALMEMRKASASASTIQKCEENLARLLVPEFPWSDYDVELRPEWSQK